MHLFGTPLTEADLALLAHSGISRDLAEAARLRRVDSPTGAEMMGRNGASGDYAGILFPYMWPGTNGDVREYRLRRDHPDIEADTHGKTKEKAKYISPPGRVSMLYFSPYTLLQWLEDASLPIIITEGEKKCLALWDLAWRGLSDATDKPRFLPVGLSGVWNWRGKVGKEDAANGERQDVKGPIPDLDRVVWAKREVAILFDVNVHTNESVRAARAMLASELRRRGAHVLFVDLPADAGINGIDDYVGKHGPDEALKLVATAYDPKVKKADSGQPSKIVIKELPDVRKIASEKVEFLVPGLLVKDALTLITGPPASGKTTLVLSMANAVAYGREIFGGTCEQHPVLYMTREMPIALAADIARRFEIDNGLGTNLFMWGPWSDEVPPEPAATCVLEWVSRTKPLLIIDPVVAFLPPGVSENDSVEIRCFFNQGRTLLRAGAVGVVYLHHTGKSDTAQAFRGSSDFEAATDVGYKVTNSGDNVLDRLLLKLFRPRFGAAQRSELLLRYTEVSGLASFVADERPEAVRESATQILKQLLAANPRISRKDFQKAAQLKGRTQAEARQFLDTGVRSKLIQLEIGHHNRHCYSLLEPSARETVQ
jgi:hypothetical protein